MEQDVNLKKEADTSLPVVFTGKAGEFFGIWIVNVLLSIVTLGIYSAWAKVRTKQYFYGNASIDGHYFRYLAKPMQILKGRLIAMAVFFVYTIVSSLNPVASIVLPILFLFAMPWLLMQGIRFNMRMTSYRNVRFAFHGSYWKTFYVMIVLPVASVFTLYLALPWVLKKIDQYIHENIAYGKQSITVNTQTGVYYKAAVACVGLMFVVGIFVALLFGQPLAEVMLSMEGAAHGEGAMPSVMSHLMIMVGLMLVYWLMLSLVGAVYRAMIRNHLLASLAIDDVCGFESNVKVLPYAWISFSNAVMVLATLGLATPVAAIRKVRYLADATNVQPKDNAVAVIEDQQASSVYGEETADVFDVDFAVG